MLQSVLALILASCLLGQLDCTGQEELTAKRGADVTLECFGPNDANIIMLKWEKPDLSGGHVFVIKAGIFQDQHHDWFKDRVELKDLNWNKTGDFSVILKYVTMNDTGRYECCAGYNEQKPVSLRNITLKVEKPDQKDVTAVSGQDVTLPCQNPNKDLIVVTEWKRAELKLEYVIFVWGGKKGQNKHLSFVNRVDLQDRQMKDGDVSLILKNVTTNDTGTYECHVIWRGTNHSKTADLETDPICIINLNVPAGQADELNKDGGNKDIGNINGGNKGEKKEEVGNRNRYALKVVVGVSVIIIIVVGFVIYKKKCRNTNKQQILYQHTPQNAEGAPLAEKADEHADMSSDSASSYTEEQAETNV